MKNILPLLFVISIFLNGIPDEVQAQDFSRNSIYVELLGNGIAYSLNYDRRFTGHIGGRIGFMMMPAQSTRPAADNVLVAIIPVMANYLVGSGSSHLELGAGLSFAFVSSEWEHYDDVLDTGIDGTVTIGYRYQPADGGFLFRIGFTPLFNFNKIFPWAGLSFGYSF